MTQNNLKFIDHICQRMIANGMVKSQAEFSADWLGQSASYLSSSKTRERNVSDARITYLFARLHTHIQNCQSQLANDPAYWQDQYEKAVLIHAEVQSFLTWKASGLAAAQLSPTQITGFVQRIGQATARLHAKRSPLANLINLATHRNSP